VWQDRSIQITQKTSGQLSSAKIGQKPSGQLANLFTLSWSHYVILMGISGAGERNFYEIEAAESGWPTPELKRQLYLSSKEELRQHLIEWTNESAYFFSKFK